VNSLLTEATTNRSTRFAYRQQWLLREVAKVTFFLSKAVHKKVKRNLHVIRPDDIQPNSTQPSGLNRDKKYK
jgi:hypothetical protein